MWDGVSLHMRMRQEAQQGSRGGPLRPAEHFLISRILSSASLSNGCRQKRGWNYIHQGVKISVFFPTAVYLEVSMGVNVSACSFQRVGVK